MISLTSIFFYNIYSFIYINFTIFFLAFFFNYVVYRLVLNQNFRMKLILFYLLLLIVSVWGFYYSLEGLVILLLLSELLIILLFTLIYLTLQFSGKNFIKSSLFLSILFLGFFFFTFYYSNNVKTIIYNNVYLDSGLLVSDDFFIFFYYFFIEYTEITIICGLLLTVFSIFFILFYFSIKLKTWRNNNKSKNLYLLRKQQLIRQANLKTSYYTFQQ